MDKIRVGLYGTNGHQINGQLAGHPLAELAAVAGFQEGHVPEGAEDIRVHPDLQALIDDPRVDLISLCSPMRSEQAAHAIACMRAGKHVYAEKPCALCEADLDAIIETAQETGMQFHEIGGTVVSRPYAAMREVVAAGRIGDVVQVMAQKCYPWHARRPSDERVDGGLALQVGVYVARFVEHIAGVKIASIEMAETVFGNPSPGSECRRAASFLMTLANGGVASGLCNYLNPMADRVWGYEILRIFGTSGILESQPESGTVRLIPPGEAPYDIDVSEPLPDYFDFFVESIRHGSAMPLELHDELSPTRWVIRAKESGRTVSFR
jgi:predicted dehydrogenase